VKRLWQYLEGRKLVAFGLVLVATGNAAAQTGGWLLVRDAIDKGIRAGNEHHLTVIVAGSRALDNGWCSASARISSIT
jgi:hypothetical protein